MDTNQYVQYYRTKRHPSMFLVILITAFLSMSASVGGLLVFFHFFPEYLSYNVTNVNKSEKEVTVTDEGIADAVEKVYDSVVIVKTYQRNKLYATGTGFVYKYSGGKYYLITNYHVIDNGDKIGIVFTNGDEVTVSVENGDKYADIAVLSFKSNQEYPVALMGNSADMRVGDTVFAIGAPLDSSVYSWSVTRGTLSGKNREVEVSTNNTQSSDWIMQVLQTDAAINHGNSGGPLCNSNGEVIGVTNMKLVTDGVEGMGFAIPIEEASRYAEAIISGEDMTRPVIGISMLDAGNTMYAREYRIEARAGVIIAEITPGGPSATSGLNVGDVIISINDIDVTGVASLRYQLYKYKVGDTVTIKYIRDGKTQTTKVTLGSNK